ncbi:Hsp20/alpha crystallin family protein [Citricoccus sp. NPDC055426]|uniref:Hsp20/alpha crystallin family protein n=1 Tax=Citricoccus sp. NPDC055426 TaxID=3155536 RepID=UPI00342E1575
MLMRTDPFRDLDRLAEQVLGTRSRPAAMPLEAWRDGDQFIIAFDLPGVEADSIDLGIEGNALTVRAERKQQAPEGAEMLAAEQPRGLFSRQVILGERLDTSAISAGYEAGVLTVRIPVAEHAKPRRIQVESTGEQKQLVESAA